MGEGVGWGGGGVWGTLTLWQSFSQKHQKKGPTEKFRNFFSYTLNYILYGKFNPMMEWMRAFISKIKAIFSVFKKGRGDLPSLPSCAPVNVAEYALISLNMPKYPCKCLNKLIWLCYGSKYAWSSYMFGKLSKMHQILNKPAFWIRHGCICKGYAEFCVCLILAPLS